MAGIVAFARDYFLVFLLVITVLVFVHEMGHYLVARWAGVRIEVFSLGFGPELFGRYDRRGTRWCVSAIPFGGYVKMYGDADPASTPSDEVGTMTAEQRSLSLHHQPLGWRAAIIAAGPAANFLFTIVVLAVLYATAGQQFALPNVGQVQPNSAAAEAGLQPGDTIRRIDGASMSSFQDIYKSVYLNTGTPMQLEIQRDGHDLSLPVTPHVVHKTDNFGNHLTFGQLGVTSGEVTEIRLNPLSAGVSAVKDTWEMGANILRGVGQMITGQRSTDDVGGAIGIVKLSGEVAKGGIVPLITFMALLSVNLGLINLFPIPVLDGGHLLFYAAEAVMGRPLGPRTQEYGFRLGLALVLTLMVFATWNDLVHLGVVAFLKGLVT